MGPICNYPIINELKNNDLKKISNNFQICYVGGIEKDRGILELVRSLKLTKNLVKLNLARNFTEKKFEEHLKKEPGWKHVNYLGYLDRDQVKKARNMLWSDICKLNPGLKRKSLDTWNDNWFKSKGHSIAPGLIPSLAQSSGAWFVRGIDNVKKSFASIWKTSDLITSMDCVIAWRPWWINKLWKPRTEGLHLDQNPFNFAFIIDPLFKCLYVLCVVDLVRCFAL